jgi:hypothetical protein
VRRDRLLPSLALCCILTGCGNMRMLNRYEVSDHAESYQSTARLFARAAARVRELPAECQNTVLSEDPRLSGVAASVFFLFFYRSDWVCHYSWKLPASGEYAEKTLIIGLGRKGRLQEAFVSAHDNWLWGPNRIDISMRAVRKEARAISCESPRQ